MAKELKKRPIGKEELLKHHNTREKEMRKEYISPKAENQNLMWRLLVKINN